jgi:mRNA interferase MazF
LKGLRRGDVHLVSLDPVRGREQGGRRPVLVVSSDAINRTPLVVTVVVGTDGRNVSRDYSTNVRVPAGVAGLPLETVFLCFQVRSLDASRFEEGGVCAPVGRLPPSGMRQVDAALRRALAL